MCDQKTYLFGIVISLLLAFPIFGLGHPQWCPDLDEDEFVDFDDFAIFAANWQELGSELAGDFDNSGLVDMNDLEQFAWYWLQEMIHSPITEDKQVSVTENHTIEITLVATDEDDEILTYHIESYPSNGSLMLDVNIATYSPFPGYDGNDSFEFYAYDGKYESNIATVSITVLPDTDGDGLSDYDEREGTYGYVTDPCDPNSDSDSMPDGWEIENGLNPTVNDSSGDADGDGLFNFDEYKYGCKPSGADGRDSDSDGLWDGTEVSPANGSVTDPANPDTDGDGIKDGDEVSWGLDPNNPDTDSDELTDGVEVAYDKYGNGNNYNPWYPGCPGAYNNYDLDAKKVDTDGDTMPDAWEAKYANEQLDPRYKGSGSFLDINWDPDNDNLTNIQEYTAGTNPKPPDGLDTDGDWLEDGWEHYGVDRWGQTAPQTEPTVADTDGDSLTDGEELGNYHDITGYGTNPLAVDSDGDNMPDGWEVDYWDGLYHTNFDPTYNRTGVPSSNYDSDNLTNLQESVYNTDPWDGDTDDDSLNDSHEVNTSGTDPRESDTDGDGLSDGDEINTNNTDPLDFDSDNDLLPDGWEVGNSLNPNSSTGDDGKDGNPDGDGATNFVEMIYGTNPQNPLDNPAALIESGKQYLNIKLTVGDHSASNSERYRLEVGSISHQAPEFGVVAEDVYPFEIGKEYEIKIVHVDSNSPEPDYDYTALVEPNEYFPPDMFILDDPDGILGVHDENEPAGDPNNTFYAEGKTAHLTLIGIDSVDTGGLQWQTYGDNIPLDDCPNNNGSKRIFPGKKDPSDENAADRNKVWIKAKIAPAIAGKTVYFHWYDADDPSSNTAPIDENGSVGGDNNGQNANFGFGDWSWGGIASAVTDGSGEARVVFNVSMQPGDNFRVFASLSEDNLRTPRLTQAKMDSLQNLPLGVKYSQMLTVWRKLWIEQDSMAAVATTGPEMNHVEGTAASYDLISTSPLRTMVNLGQNLPDAFDDENQFMYGTYIAGAFSYTTSLSTAYLNDWDEVRVWGDPNGDGAPMGYKLYDDDDNTLLPTYPSLGSWASVFHDAYIEPCYLPSSYSDEVIFYRNLDSTGASLGWGEWNNFYDCISRKDFWTTLVVSSFQPETSKDFDPDEESQICGQTVLIGNESILYLETIRDGGKSIEKSTAHEIGHAGGVWGHFCTPGCLMHEDAQGNFGDHFCDECIHNFRKDSNW